MNLFFYISVARKGGEDKIFVVEKHEESGAGFLKIVSMCGRLMHLDTYITVPLNRLSKIQFSFHRTI